MSRSEVAGLGGSVLQAAKDPPGDGKANSEPEQSWQIRHVILHCRKLQVLETSEILIINQR